MEQVLLLNPPKSEWATAHPAPPLPPPPKWVLKFAIEGYEIRWIFGKNKHTPRKLLYFVNRDSVELSKICHYF